MPCLARIHPLRDVVWTWMSMAVDNHKQVRMEYLDSARQLSCLTYIYAQTHSGISRVLSLLGEDWMNECMMKWSLAQCPQLLYILHLNLLVQQAPAKQCSQFFPTQTPSIAKHSALVQYPCFPQMPTSLTQRQHYLVGRLLSIGARWPGLVLYCKP